MSVSKIEGVEHDLFGQLRRARLDHVDGLGRARDDEVQLALFLLLKVGVEDELAIDASDADGSRRGREGDGGALKRDRGGRQGGDLGRVLLIAGEDGDVNHHVVAHALGEERADRAVGEARVESLDVARTRLTLEKVAGDAA